jgi:hypothetical protein
MRKTGGTPSERHTLQAPHPMLPVCRRHLRRAMDGMHRDAVRTPRRPACLPRITPGLHDAVIRLHDTPIQMHG